MAVKKKFLKKIVNNDRKYEEFKKNITNLQNEKSNQLREKISQDLEKFSNTAKNNEINEGESPAELWFKAIKKGRF